MPWRTAAALREGLKSFENRRLVRISEWSEATSKCLDITRRSSSGRVRIGGAAVAVAGADMIIVMGIEEGFFFSSF